MKCIGSHASETEATGYVRYVRAIDNQEKILGPYCDACQVDICVHVNARTSEVRSVGGVPLDYQERIDVARRQGIVRRIREELTVHPGTPEEVADDLFAVVKSLMEGYTVPGLSSLLADRIGRWHAEQDEGAAMMRAEINPEEWF